MLEAAAWLTARCLLLIAGRGLEVGASLESARLESCRFPAASLGSAADRGPDGLFVVLPDSASFPEDDSALFLGTQENLVRLIGGEVAEKTTDLQAFVRRVLAPLDSATRSEVIQSFASMLAMVPEPVRQEMSEKLFEVREALRERLPMFSISSNATCGAHVDHLMAIDDRSFHIEGWIQRNPAQIVRLTAISPEGNRAELIERLVQYVRPDVAEALPFAGGAPDASGFVCFFELDAPSVRPDGWILEIESDDGVALEIGATLFPMMPLEARDAILAGRHLVRSSNGEVMREHVFPAVDRVQRGLHEGATVASDTQLGAAPQSPDVTIVVPIARQLELLEIQLSQFADDPELRAEADLVYVVGSHQVVDALQHAADVFPVYGVPFRIAAVDESLGFAGAANGGATLGKGRLLLLMEPSVIPAHPGWLGALRSFYERTPAIGALGPKLLNEDDSIRHAGTYFYKRPGSKSWSEDTHFKGIHRLLPAANVARPVTAASKACLMIDRKLFRKTGGLPPVYTGDRHGVLDLCLQLADQGLETWYLPEVELYHLEGSSPADDQREGAEQYDEWLYASRWDTRIALSGEAAQGTNSP